MVEISRPARPFEVGAIRAGHDRCARFAFPGTEHKGSKGYEMAKPARGHGRHERRQQLFYNFCGALATVLKEAPPGTPNRRQVRSLVGVGIAEFVKRVAADDLEASYGG